MKVFSVAGRLQPDFKVLGGTDLSEAATMVIPSHQSAGGADNFHEASDQWILVLSGTGVAVVARRSVELARGTLLLVEAGETHEVRNTGSAPLEMVTFYAPPVY
jgi:mannose-6-phosphate isomerase-like protein (cupin superfamily)